MKFIKILLLFVLFLSQSGIPAQDSSDKQSKSSRYADSMEKIIKDLQTTIEVRLGDIEKKHEQLAILKPSYKDKHTIVTEDVPFKIEDGFEANLLKYIRFEYESGKLKEIEISSRKRRIYYELAFEYKSLVIPPSDVMSTEILLKKFDTDQKTVLKDTSIENQIRALRFIEASLRNAYYRMDVLIVILKEKRDRENEYQLDL
jgi:transposase